MQEIIDLSYRNKLSHLSSTLSAYPIIKDIYSKMREDDVFVLSQGHAALALYVVLGNAQDKLDRFGMECVRSPQDGIHVSTGSLGMGLTVALGMAMAGRTVHCLISDGECAEGAVWEALALAYKYAPSLHVYVNYNGMSALGAIDPVLVKRLLAFMPSIKICYSEPLDLPYTRGLEAHYHVITEAEYAQIIR